MKEEGLIGTARLFRLWDGPSRAGATDLWANTATHAADEWSWIRRRSRICALVSECDADGAASIDGAVRVVGLSKRHVSRMLSEFDRRVSVLRAKLVESLNPLTGNPSDDDLRSGRILDDADDVRSALHDVSDVVIWLGQSERDAEMW